MAKNKELKLSIKILGNVDKSLDRALGITQSKVSGLSKSINNIGTVGLASMTAFGVGAVAAITKATNKAQEFESQMADVVKYVDGLADATGRIDTDKYAEMSDAILDLSTKIPLTAEELTKLAAAAGQSGKSMDDLLKYSENGQIEGFLRDTAMMAKAMDIDAEQAGDWAAKWEKAFNTDHEGVLELSDVINYLGANSATTAAEIATVVNTVGGLGTVAGLETKNMAALADAFLATGTDAARTSTSIRNIMVNLTAGTAATDKQKKAFQALGLSAEGVSEAMQVNSSETLADIFARIANLPKANRLSIINQLFSKRAVDGAAKIAENTEVFTDALMMANSAEVKGSMAREFYIKTNTTEAAGQMFTNAMDRAGINIGTAFLPVRKSFYEAATAFLDVLDKNMPQIEKISGSLAELATGGITKLGDAFEKALPFIEKGLDYLVGNGGSVAKGAGGLAGMFALMKLAPAAETLGRGAFGLGGSLLGSIGTRRMNGSRRGASGILGLLAGAPRALGGYLGGIGRAGSAALPGMASSLGGIAGLLSRSPLAPIAGWYASGFKGLGKGFSLLGSNYLMPGLRAAGGEAVSLAKFFASPLTKAASPLMPFLSKVGGAIGNAAGMIPGALGTAGSLLGPLLSGVGSIGGAAFGPELGLLFNLMNPLVGGGLGIAGVITGVLLLKDHLEDIRTLIGNTFGDQGLAMFDKFTEVVGNGAQKVRDFCANTPVLSALLGVFDKFVAFADERMKPAVEGVFGYLTTVILPKIIEHLPQVEALITAVGDATINGMNLVMDVVEAAKPLLKGAMEFLVDGLFPGILEGGTVLFQGISKIIDDGRQLFTGLIDFITGVFAGDWEKAWTGIKDVFGGIFSGLVDLVKTPVNTIITFLNKTIGGIAGVASHVPKLEWLANFKALPLFANGGFTSGPSIAGEAGTEAIISFNRAARKQNLSYWAQAGQMLGIKELSDIGGFGSGNVTFAPVITIQGNADREVMNEAVSEMKRQFEAWYREMQNRERRIAY